MRGKNKVAHVWDARPANRISSSAILRSQGRGRCRRAAAAFACSEYIRAYQQQTDLSPAVSECRSVEQCQGSVGAVSGQCRGSVG
jgi:hypothetical protein